MPNIQMFLPEYIQEIIEVLKQKNWIIHYFKISDDEIYSIHDYVYNHEINNVKYELLIDRNIFQFLVNSVRKDKIKPIYREAVALIVFCQLARIQIDPTMAVYEKINYKDERANEAIDELRIFRNLDNTDNEILANFALDHIDKIDISTNVSFDENKLKSRLTKYERLLEWDSIYLLILGMVNIYLEKGIPRKQKFKEFYKWSFEKFRRSFGVVLYASFLFSKTPTKSMVKYKSNSSRQDKKQQLKNMTWDLFIMNHFMRAWQKKSEHQEILFASDDFVLKTMMKVGISIEAKMSIEGIQSFIDPEDYVIISETIEQIDNESSRVYQTENWTYDYRDELIEEFENKLLPVENI